jgi:hypothetical protein
LILKDGYAYHDDSPDPQAVTRRDKEGAVESRSPMALLPFEWAQTGSSTWSLVQHRKIIAISAAAE